MSRVFRLGFILFGTLWVLELGGSFLPHFRNFSTIISSSIFSWSFFFVFLFWASYDSILGVFNIVPEVSEVVLISFNSFFFFPLFHLFLPFYLLPHYPVFCLHYSTVGSLQRVFLSCLLHYSLYIDSF